MLTRETATFTDDDGWSWEFDLTFMLSHYGCIWGCGCPDIEGQGTARGCCALGVEVYRGAGDDEGEVRAVDVAPGAGARGPMHVELRARAGGILAVWVIPRPS